jgi:putative Mg2+ transporter-C (MgtC) family protein
MIHVFALSVQSSLSNLFSHFLARLLLAAVLGGIIGMERQLKRRPAGLRTHMLICVGAALFTILSEELAAGFTADRTRIASQIIPGIGFIGAGSILRARGSVTGLTTAATIFVVASIGMACGGGLYWLAVFSALLIVVCLAVLGRLETQFNLKSQVMHYSIESERSADEILDQVTTLMDERGKEMQDMRLRRLNGKKKIVFSVEGTHSEQEELLERLKQSPGLQNISASPERDIE